MLLELTFNQSIVIGLLHCYIGVDPCNTNVTRDLEDEFACTDTCDSVDIDSTSHTGVRIVEEIFNLQTKYSTTTTIEQRSKKQRSQQMSYSSCMG